MPKYALMTETKGSHKMRLGVQTERVGEAVLYLSPSTEAGEGINMCPGHSPECFKFCLIHSGLMIMPHAKLARIRKTKLLLERPLEFGVLLQRDVDTHLRWTASHDLAPAFRFNGTSDYNWETFLLPHLGRTIHDYLLEVAPEAHVNEYTKRYSVMRRWLEGAYAPNLHMTYSLHELNERFARQILHLGGNVAIVFRVKLDHPLPTSWWGHPVLDGDVDDLRWLDAERALKRGFSVTRGLVIGLRHKGRLARAISPFSLDPGSHLPLLRAA